MPEHVLLHAVDDALLRVTPGKNHQAKKAASILSAASRGGAGWVASSGVLALAGPRYRRASVEGLAAWLVAEGAAGALKRLTHRRRPRLWRRTGPSTGSSSMPSAHTAAGVAYAVAAGARAPVAAAPLGMLAAAVAWSRLSTRRHFPTDVATAVGLGAAVGVAVAVASRRLVRTSSDEAGSTVG